MCRGKAIARAGHGLVPNGQSGGPEGRLAVTLGPAVRKSGGEGRSVRVTAVS